MTKPWTRNEIRSLINIIVIVIAVISGWFVKININYLQDNITIITAEINSLKANLTEINSLISHSADIKNLKFRQIDGSYLFLNGTTYLVPKDVNKQEYLISLIRNQTLK